MICSRVAALITSRDTKSKMVKITIVTGSGKFCLPLFFSNMSIIIIVFFLFDCVVIMAQYSI